MTLLALTDLQAELGMDSTELDDQSYLTFLCQAVQSLFEQKTGRKFEQDQVTEYYTCEKYQRSIRLKNYPVLEINSVYDDPDWEYGSDSLVDTSDYTCDFDLGILYNAGYFSDGPRSVKVTYRYGYVTSVPDPEPSYGYYLFPSALKHLWLRQAAVWYHNMKNSGQGVLSRSDSVTGATVTKVDLEKGLLPEFDLLAQEWRRI